MQSGPSLPKPKLPRAEFARPNPDKDAKRSAEPFEAPLPVSNPSTRSKVGTLMKRRYSKQLPSMTSGVRQAQLLAQEAAVQTMPQPVSSQTAKFGVKLDVQDIDAPGFDPERYIKEKLSNLTEKELREFYQELKSSVQTTSGALQKNVFKNYAEFVTISKEISNFESDMLVLRGLLEEWRVVNDSLNEEDSSPLSGITTGDSGLPRRRTAVRNSVADLQLIWKAQMEALWEGVEASQKFLPHAPGRRVIRESSSFVELNAATYKVKQAVHLFLLNDHFLVAVKKKRQMSSKIKLVAERCWPLSDLVVVDLKENEVSNAIKIKKGKESFIYRTDKVDEKKTLLASFRHVAEELFAKKRKEQEQELRARDPGFDMNSDPRFSMDGMPTTPGRSSFSSDDNSKDYSFIDDIVDETDIHIALRNFEDAASTIEKARMTLAELENDIVGMEMLRTKIEARSEKLTQVLCRDLSMISLRKVDAIQTIGWLNRLGQGYAARNIFLESRSRLIKSRGRQIKFQGDIPSFIGELATVTFTLIKETSEWYTSAFSDARMASGFIRWATTEVESFAGLFERQVYGFEDDVQIFKDAYESALVQAESLRKVGLDLRFILKERIGR